ncbi:MAG: 2-dehydropantoate 2-reductase [Anaerolineales bacterium]|nr:2-dehydropantoate 2-reductase [Anaerolineales bacterium]
MPEPILIVGTGALACLFAARLSAVGVEVTMLGTWPKGLRALQHGVQLEDNGKETIYPVRATSNPADCFGMRHALVLVKAWQTERAAHQLGMCLAPDGVALTLQNGYGNREILAKSLGVNNVALGVTTTGATLTGPGRVRPGGQGTISVESHPRLEPIIPLLRDAGFVVEETPNADSLVWSKLVINAAINPLTALLRIPNGELLERPSARALMADLAREAAAVAAAAHIPLTFLDPVAAAEDVARRTATNHSSMYQDIQRGAPTEIDAICGAIVHVGEKLGVATPVNKTIWKLIKAGRIK